LQNLKGHMQRIFLFLVTNLAVAALLSVVLFVLERVTGLRADGDTMTGLLVVATVLGAGGALISLALSKWIAKRSLRVRVIGTPRSEVDAWLLKAVRRLAAGAGIGMPEVGVFETDDMNAFATGARRNAALVAVSTGLLRGMSRRQVEAVLGHEISHVANGDMVTLTLLQGILNTFVILTSRLIGTVIDRAVFQDDRAEGGSGRFGATLCAEIVLGVFAGMIIAWFSRHREFRADRGGAELTGTGDMVGALQALKRSHGPSMPARLQLFGINTGALGGFMSLFTSHPPLDARIAALRAA
jgi:heat shock protein HtpX